MAVGLAREVGFERPGCVLPTVICLPLLNTSCFVFSLFSAGITRGRSTGVRAARCLGPGLPRTRVGNNSNVKNGCRGVLGTCKGVRSRDTIRGVSQSGRRRGRRCRDGCSSTRLRRLSTRTGERTRLRGAERTRRTRRQRERGTTLTRLGGTLTRTELGKRRTARRGSSSSTVTSSRAATAIGNNVGVRNGVGIGRGTQGRTSRGSGPDRIIGGIGASSSCFGALTIGRGRPALVGTVVSRGIGTISKDHMHLELLSSIRVNRVVIGGNTCLCTVVDNFDSRQIGKAMGDILISSRVIGVGLSLCSASNVRNLCIPDDRFERAAGSITDKTIANGISVGAAGANDDFSR